MAIIFLKEVRLSFAQNLRTPGRPTSNPNAKLKYGATTFTGMIGAPE